MESEKDIYIKLDWRHIQRARARERERKEREKRERETDRKEREKVRLDTLIEREREQV